MSTAPPQGTRVRYRHLGDIICDTMLTSRSWTWTTPPEDFRGYLAEVYHPAEEADEILSYLKTRKEDTIWE